MTAPAAPAPDPADAPSPAEIAALAAGLRRLAAHGRGMPRLPFPVLAALKGVAPLPVAELCVAGPEGGVLLTWRDDDYWRGWHFPGGLIAPGESLAAACDRIAARELAAGFALEGVAGVECWPAHPWADIVAILCRGRLDRAPADGRFFATPPDDLLAEQRPYFDSLARGGLVAADLTRRR